MLANLWRYRAFIYSSVKRDFLSRYQGSIFGIAWSVFQSLAMILVYTLIFSNIMRSKLPGLEGTVYAYSIYLCAGTLPWGMFCEMLNGCTNVFIANGNLMKKVAFPRICLPAITACSAVLNFMIGFSLFLIFMVMIGQFPWHAFWVLPLLILIQSVFALSLGIGLGVLNVFFRDVGQLLGVVLQFWFWFTPLVYPLNIVPPSLRDLMVFNPMYPIMRGYQEIFLYDRLPAFWGLAAVFLLSLLLGAWALRLYRRHVGEMVDEL